MKLRNHLVSISLALALAGAAGCGGEDAKQAEAPRPASPIEITAASGRVSGGGVIVDVQIGHFFAQNPTTGAGTRVEAAAAVK